VPNELSYFYWLCDFIGGCGNYTNLLKHLHKIDFIYLISMDGNRAEDGIRLRYRYNQEFAEWCGRKPCSVLEMMIALAVRCEENIMGNDAYGDRTRYWFYSMIDNLGLSNMTDTNYNSDLVNKVLDKFLYRQYEPNGSGGLFIFDNPRIDARSMEIWMQLNWYLNDYI
jgi:hypothetical protein